MAFAAGGVLPISGYDTVITFLGFIKTNILVIPATTAVPASGGPKESWSTS